MNQVAAPDELLALAGKIASTIASKGPIAVSQSKRVILRGFDADLGTANELEAQAFSALFGTADQREGTSAFLEKRAAKFKGE